jgi:hypothetical protein
MAFRAECIFFGGVGELFDTQKHTHTHVPMAFFPEWKYAQAWGIPAGLRMKCVPCQMTLPFQRPIGECHCQPTQPHPAGSVLLPCDVAFDENSKNTQGKRISDPTPSAYGRTACDERLPADAARLVPCFLVPALLVCLCCSFRKHSAAPPRRCPDACCIPRRCDSVKNFSWACDLTSGSGFRPVYVCTGSP